MLRFSQVQTIYFSTSDVFILVCLTYWHWCVIFASVYLPLVCCVHEWYTNMPCIYIMYMYIGTNCVQNCSFLGTCWSTVHENFQNLWPESATEWTCWSIFSQHNGKSLFVFVKMYECVGLGLIFKLQVGIGLHLGPAYYIYRQVDVGR